MTKRKITIGMGWVDRPSGGIVHRTMRNGYLARPKGVGMNEIRWFPTEDAAVAYADSPVEHNPDTYEGARALERWARRYYDHTGPDGPDDY